MKREELLNLIKDRKSKEIKDISFDDLLALGYRECMFLAYDLFAKNLHDSELQEFAAELFFRIRDQFPTEWDMDWKNDAYLGQVCGLTWRYDESYECYKRAYDKLSDPPDVLLLLLASCNSAPGKPPINDDESEFFLKRALAKNVTYEGAINMRGLARNKKDPELEKYWNKKCHDLEKANVHTEVLVPDIFREKQMYTKI
jgi:hypothetical protein